MVYINLIYDRAPDRGKLSRHTRNVCVCVWVRGRHQTVRVKIVAACCALRSHINNNLPRRGEPIAPENLRE